MIEQLRPDDVVVVWRLDRLGRSLKNLIELSNRFGKMEVGLRSLSELIDTPRPTVVCTSLSWVLCQSSREI